MCKAFFIFNKDEFDNLQHLIGEDDIVVSVSYLREIESTCHQHIILDSWQSEEINLELFNSFYKYFLKIDTDIWAFSNNFYETNFEYHLKLKKIISLYNIEEFFFYQKNYSLSLFGTNKLVGAEYETQKKFLYNRNSSFQNTIRKIIGKEKTRYLIKKRKITFDVIFNFFRIILIAGNQFLRILKSFRNISKSHDTKWDSKYLYIFRSSLSYDFSKFRKMSKHIDVAYFNSLSSKSKINLNENVTKYYLHFFDVFIVLKEFLINFTKLLFTDTRYEGVNYKQSFLEIQIMSILPKLYYRTLKRIFSQITEISIIFNFEVKSPYAYFDQKLSDATGFKLITLLYFDLHVKRMPEFFYSKFLHVNTNEMKLNLESSIDDSKSIFSLQNLNESYDLVVDYTYDYCLFLDCTSFDENEFCINFLIEHDYNFCVRVHPRDSWKYKKEFQKYFIDRSISNNEFFKIFRFAISGASAIVQNLIDNNKPFYLLVEKGFGHTKIMHYFNDSYYGNIYRLKDILNKTNLNSLENSFKSCYYVNHKPLNIEDFYNKIELIVNK